MAEHDDLEALRRIDPVNAAALPSADEPKARALFERITMTQTAAEPVHTTDETSPAPPSRRRPLLVVAVAAVVVLVLGVVGAMALRGDDDANTEVDNGDVADAPISPGGAALCVEMYDLTTLKNREVAFDGTVKAVEGDSITFTVNESYRGVDGTEVTLAGAGTLGAMTSVGEATTIDPGTRLLVAGDGEFAWSCGFTQPYDPSVAAEWKTALS
jgi:hypothetical protein